MLLRIVRDLRSEEVMEKIEKFEREVGMSFERFEEMFLKGKLDTKFERTYLEWAELVDSYKGYVEDGQLDYTIEEIRNFEPSNALLAAENGLYFYHQILERAKEHLNTNGMIYFEIGYNEADRIRQTALQNGFSSVDIFQDLNGFDRIVKIK